MPLDQEHDQDKLGFDRSVMSFGDHLEELRHRVILGILVPLPLMIILFPFSDDLRAVLCAPVFSALESSGLPAQLQAMNPAETLGTDLKLSIIFALVLSCPWILWQAWKFIEPGLYKQERRFVHLLIPGSVALTIAGLALLYFVMLPLMLRVLIAFGIPGDQPSFPIAAPAPTTATSPTATTESMRIPVLADQPSELAPGTMWISPHDNTLQVAVPVEDGDGTRVEVLMVPLSSEGMVVQQYRLSEYINFVLMLMIGIAIAFQMPLVILLLGWVGIVRPSTLGRNRKYALLACAFVSAITTPADIVSMFLMLIPLYGLYEFGILLLKFAPAERVARGSLFKGAVEDVLGRFDRGDSDEPDSNSSPDDEDPGTSPDDEDPGTGPDDEDPGTGPEGTDDPGDPPFPTDSGGPPTGTVPSDPDQEKPPSDSNGPGR